VCVCAFVCVCVCVYACVCVYVCMRGVCVRETTTESNIGDHIDPFRVYVCVFVCVCV